MRPLILLALTLMFFGELLLFDLDFINVNLVIVNIFLIKELSLIQQLEVFYAELQIVSLEIVIQFLFV